MTFFDPTENKPAYSPPPAGSYLLALKSFERRVSKAGNPYIKGRWLGLYLDGSKEKTYTLFMNISIDVEREGARKMLGALCAAMGCNEGFNPEKDLQVQSAMCWRAFFTTITVEEDGQYSNANWGRFKYPDSLTAEEQERVRKWSAYVKKKAQDDGIIITEESEFDEDGGAPSGADDDSDDFPF